MPSAYITRAGFENLQGELDDIWKRRADVVKALSAAAAEGDRSENAEYIYRKKELGGLDRRIRYLQKRLPAVKIVEPDTAQSKAFFGAWVELENEAGERVVYRIVGADETDAKLGYISLDSPVSRALLGKSRDDDFKVKIGDATKEFTLVDLWYQPRSDD